MKKIIATVLAMVMALALCTTAFAATTSETVTNGTTTTLNSADKYNVRAMAYTTDEPTAWTGTITVTTLSTKSVVTDGKETKTYIPSFYTYNNEKYVVCDEDVAGAVRLFKDSTFVAYVVKVTGDLNFYPAATAVKKGTNCGDYASDGYKVGDSVYSAGTGNYAVVDGKLVAYTSTTISTIPHDFKDGATVTYKANSTTPISVVCKTCKKSFEVVDKNKLGTYAGEVVIGGTANATAIGDAYAIKVGTDNGTVAGTTTGTTTSPKTFDAGIAMYVGMALTSVAGSAVVIGKKKEF